MSDYRVAGKPVVRLDGRAKVTGDYIYGMDYRLPGSLHGKVVRSPHPHARILGFRTEKAAKLPGVRAIITGADVQMLMPGGIIDQPLLAWDITRYKGEPVALIAATKPEIAEAAAKLLEIDYELLPVITDPVAAMEPGAPLLHPDWAAYASPPSVVRDGNVCCHASLIKGDVEQGFAEADVIIEDSYATESVHQSHVEPRAAVGVVSADGKATIYSNTQLPFWIRTNVAYVLGVPESDVVVVPTGIGGGFGSKLYPQIEPLVALLARKTGRPVRIVTPVSEELEAGLPRHPSRIWIRTGVKRDGTVVASQGRVVLDTGAYAGSGPELASIGVIMMSGPYKTPHLRMDAYSVYTNKTNFGAYRGPGGPQAMFALESHLDHIAQEIGIDPLQLRLKNIVEEGDEAANGQKLSAVGLRECLERVAAAIEWDKPALPNRGRGLTCGWWTTTLQSSGVHVKLDSDGHVIMTIGTQEIGSGAVMAGVPQAMAEYMGVPVENVRVVVGDTSTGPWDWGSQGSRTVFNISLAAKNAAADLTEQIKEIAADMLEVADVDLEIRDGMVQVKGSPEHALSLAAISQKALETKGGLLARGVSHPEPAQYDQNRMISCLYPAFHFPSFHAHAAEVEVDPGTGEVRVTRYVAAHDIGFAISPVYAAGQIHGGVVQGIGMALMEQIQYRDGVVLNPSWTDYKLPTMSDVPDIEAILVEHPAAGGPFGAKGLGESPVIHPPAAIANAVAQATGVRINSLPITSEKVLRALHTNGMQKQE
ncbi:MAG: xanthine dehydrogenase family protein molybdopterin-binding subunit [Chloroflexi bacterium]|nr:xanthine dehydrogenase family protein molybdopterin-binding subunit [Chloroflexota bacterium]